MRPFSRIAVAALVVLAVVLPHVAVAQSTSPSDTAVVFPPLSRADRQKLVVVPLSFTAQLTDAQKAELNSLSNVVAIWRGGGNGASVNQGLVNLGRSASDILVEQLMHTERFRIIERGSLGDSASLAAGSLTQQAKALGAAFMVTGSISKFAEVKKKNALGGAIGGALGRRTGGLIGGGMGSGKSIYVVGMTVRVVDVESGEVVSTFTTEGELEGDKARSLLAGVLGTGGGAAGGISSQTTGERELRIAEALHISAANLAVRLVESQMRGDLALVP